MQNWTIDIRASYVHFCFLCLDIPSAYGVFVALLEMHYIEMLIVAAYVNVEGYDHATIFKFLQFISEITKMGVA